MAVLDRIPMERIGVEARDMHPAATLLTLIAALLYAVGWAAAKVLGVIWLGLCWCAAAVKVGWSESRGKRGAGS